MGTSRHFYHDDGNSTWVLEVPTETWHLSGEQKSDSEWCLDSLFALNDIEIETDPPSKFMNAMNVLVPSGSLSSPPWEKLLNSRDFEGFLKTLVQKIDRAMDGLNERYYKNTWVKENRVFNSLHCPRVNGEMWRELTLANRENRMLKSFMPDENGFARPVKYSRTSTRTGRLTVKSGPQILTLNKPFRSIISPIDPVNDCVGAFDFNALEMRVLLYEAGFNCDEVDLYAMIKRLYLPKIERNIVKGAVIGRTYGLSKHVWGGNLGIKGRTLNHVDDTLSNLIDTSFLLRRIKEQYSRDGFIRNRYDRRVKIDVPLDHVIINTYAQSTGNDVALMGFSSILDRLESLGAKALYLLHDSLIVNFPRKNREEIEKITTVKVPGYVQRFHLKFELMSCTGKKE